MAVEILAPESEYARSGFEVPQGPDRSVEVLFNNPARALTYLVAATNPNHSYTAAALGNELATLQGASPGWQLNLTAFNAPRSYGDTTLVPAQLFDAVTTVNRYGKVAKGYKANDKNLPFRIATAATALDWELQFPHLKLSDLLGDTRLNAKESMPLTCVKIYEILLNASNGAASLFEIANQTERNFYTINRSLQVLAAEGVIIKQSKFNFERQILLGEPDERYKKNHRQLLGAVGNAIYTTAEHMNKQGITSIDAQSFVAKILDSHPEMDPADIRTTLIHNPPKHISFADIEEFNGKHTLFRIHSDLQPAIADLVLRYQKLNTDPDFIRAATKRASEILRDPSAVSFLMRKAKPKTGDEPYSEQWNEDPRAVLRARIGSLTLQRLPIEPQWEKRSFCRALVDKMERLEDKIAVAELFFPPGTKGPSREQAETAKEVCRRCPARVAASCLQWALDTRQKKGVFGGMTPEERRKYRNQKPRVDVLQVNPTRPRTNAEVSELLEGVAAKNQASPSRNTKDLQKQG